MPSPAVAKYKKKPAQYKSDYGVSIRQVYRWIEKGLPLDDPAAMRAHLGLQKHTAPGLTPAAVLDRKEKKLDLECQKLEFNLSVARGQYTDNARIREDLTVIATAMRAGLMRLENDLPGQLAGLDSAAIQIKIRTATDGIMSQLSDSLSDLYPVPKIVEAVSPPSP